MILHPKRNRECFFVASHLNFFTRHKLSRFLGIFFSLLVSWYFIYELWLHPQGLMDSWVVNNAVGLADALLSLLGYEVHTSGGETMRQLSIAGGGLLWVGDPCNGIELFALFSAFIIAFPGSILKKVFFIPAGLLLIHFLNVLRLVALSLLMYYAPQYLAFNHTYTFTILMYGFIFFLIYLWVTYFAPLHRTDATKK